MPLIGNVKAPWFFSVNKFNLFSFNNKDHANRDGKKIIDWVYEKLKSVDITQREISQVTLLTHPRCFGFVFNPVSFYFCLNEEHNPVAIIAEVNNTFSQTHSYIIREDDLSPINSNKIYKTPKDFFVSPFFRMEGHYEFRFSYHETKVSVFINYFKQGELAFETFLTGKVVDFTTKNSLSYALTTFKTVMLIGFQAFILRFVKKLKFSRPQSNQ